MTKKQARKKKYTRKQRFRNRRRLVAIEAIEEICMQLMPSGSMIAFGRGEDEGTVIMKE
jgi:hypothetical protein